MSGHKINAPLILSSAVPSNEIKKIKKETLKKLQERTNSYYEQLKAKEKRKISREKGILDYKKKKQAKALKVKEIRKSYIQKRKRRDQKRKKERTRQETKYQKEIQERDDAFQKERKKFIVKKNTIKKIKKSHPTPF